MKSNRHILLYIAFPLVALISASCTKEASVSTEHDAELLGLVLEHMAADNNFISVLEGDQEDSTYIVVDPFAEILTGLRSVQGRADTICTLIRTEDCDLDWLVNQLSDKNQDSTLLPLESNPEKRYIVDTDGRYAAYFGSREAGGWDAWYAENQNAAGACKISLPVYDSLSAVVLVYVGIQVQWLAGEGFLIAFRYEDGRLSELGRVMLWIS